MRREMITYIPTMFDQHAYYYTTCGQWYAITQISARIFHRNNLMPEGEINHDI